MVTVPGLTPVTMPVEPTVAIPGAELLHVPPATTSDKVMCNPVMTLDAPLIVPAKTLFTVTT